MRRFAVLAIILAVAAAGCVHCGQNSPRIVKTTMLKGGAIEIEWLSKESVKYEVLSATKPDADEKDWTVEATVVGGPSKTTKWVDTKATDQKQKLYRVREVENAD